MHAVLVLFLVVFDYWIRFNLYGQAGMIAAGIWGIYLNIHALIKMRNRMNRSSIVNHWFGSSGSLNTKVNVFREFFVFLGN